jgi:uncharacterized protein YdaT
MDIFEKIKNDFLRVGYLDGRSVPIREQKPKIRAKRKKIRFFDF